MICSYEFLKDGLNPIHKIGMTMDIIHSLSEINRDFQ